MAKILVGLIAIGLWAQPSRASTITFTTAPIGGFAAPYSESGYTLTPLHSAAADEHPPAVSTTMSFVDGPSSGFPGLATFDGIVLGFHEDFPFGSPVVVITKDDGGVFDFVSVTVGNLNRPFMGGFDDGFFNFVGSLSGGGTVVVLDVHAAGVPSIVTLPGFVNLTSLRIIGADAAFPVIDDIVLNEVPHMVPDGGSTLAMLAFGIGVAARRRHRLEVMAMPLSMTATPPIACMDADRCMRYTQVAPSR
jgi:hypothetical protein